MQAERDRIREQVRRFLGYLANLDAGVLRDHLSLAEVVPTLRQLIGGDRDDQDQDMFRQRFITPGNDVDLADWDTVQRMQIIMITFTLNGLYDDPVTAHPDGELTDSS